MSIRSPFLPVIGRKGAIRLLAALSVAGCGWILWRLDWRQMAQALVAIRWDRFLLLFILMSLYWVLRSVNWFLVLRACDCPVPFRKVFAVRLASNTVNCLVPSANIGGEALRLFAFPHFAKKKLLASLLIDKISELVTIIALTFVSLCWIFVPGQPARGGHRPLLLGAVLSLALAAWLFFMLQHHLLGKLCLAGKRLGLPPKWLEKIELHALETDEVIVEFHRKHRQLRGVLIAVYALQLTVWTCQLYLIFRFSGTTAVGFAQCFLLLNLGALSLLLPSPPGALGVYEFSNISLFALMGIPMSYGVASLVIRRVIGYLIAGLGVIPLLGMGLIDWKYRRFRQPPGREAH